jgi:hypothetical protein
MHWSYLAVASSAAAVKITASFHSGAHTFVLDGIAATGHVAGLSPVRAAEAAAFLFSSRSRDRHFFGPNCWQYNTVSIKVLGDTGQCLLSRFTLSNFFVTGSPKFDFQRFD